MANLTENTQNPVWSAGIYQIETSDPVLGGANGIANRQAKELAARTQWLRTELAKAISSIGTNQSSADTAITLKANHTTQFTAGAGLTGGGDLSANRTIGLATPSTLSGSTTNWVGNGATGHTHEIAKATPTVAGVVKLVNVLNSTATDAALTAAQGKLLSEKITAAVSGSFNLRGLLTTQNLNDLAGSENYGVWQNAGNSNATSERNYPTNKAGTLLVLPSGYKGQQIYFPFEENSIWIRDTRSNATETTWGQWFKLGDDKLGNSGSQTLSGSLTVTQPLKINNPNTWHALEMNAGDGIWVLETNPQGSVDRRFQFKFTKTGESSLYCRFPTLVKNETVAYESWVSSGFVSLTSDQTISGVKTFSGDLNTTKSVNAGGLVSTSYHNDWVGFLAKNPTEGKNGFFDLMVNQITRGGMQIVAEGSGRYSIKLMVTPAGATNTDRRVAGLTVYDNAIHSTAYGLLHDYFARKNEFANSRAQNGYQKLPNGLILQWGTSNGTRATFPIAFNECFSVTTMSTGVNDTWNFAFENDNTSVWVSVRPDKISGFKYIAIGR